MAQKPYTGFRGKSFWDISNFSKGVRYTNESLKEGTLAMLTNLNITGSGASLVPRHPYINSLFKIDRVYGEDAAPTPLGKQTYLYTPIQKSGAEYFITLNHLRPENTVVEYNLTDVSYEVIDGDTIKIDGEVFRLLGIDAPEIDTREGQLSKAFLENLIYEWEHNIPPGVGEQPILEVIFDKFNPNSVDTYGRKLVWLSLPVTESEFLNWIPPYDGDPISYEDSEAPHSWHNSPPDGTRITSEFSAHSWVNGQALVKSNYRTFPENIGDMMVKVADSTSPGKYFYYQSRLRTESLTQLVNKELFVKGHAQPMGYYNKEEGTKLSLPKYSFTDMSSWHRTNWEWKDEVEFIEVEQYPAIFKKDAKTVLKPHQEGVGHTKIPYIDLTEENFLNTSGVAEDMGLSAGHPLTIEFVSEYVEKEHEKYNINTEIRSLTTMPYFDGFMFIGKVLDRGTVLYKGPMSVNYEVPLTEDSLEVDWENAFFRIRSYKNDIYKLNYADLETTSPNLLQGGTISTASLFGKEAEDEGENFPRIKAILLRESKENPTKVFSEIRGDKEYFIHPMVVIPPMNEINGLGIEELNYHGYAYRWVVTSLTGTTLSSTSTQEELRWKSTETKTLSQGTVGVIEEGLSCSLEGDLQATSVGVARTVTEGTPSTENNFNNAPSGQTGVKLVGESLEDLGQDTEVVVVSQIPAAGNRRELYLGRTVAGSETPLSNDPYRMGSLSNYLTKFGAVVSTYDVGDNLDDLAHNYFKENTSSTKIYGLSWGNNVEYYLPRKSVEYKKVSKTPLMEYNQFICVPEPVVSYTDWIQGFDSDGKRLDNGLRDWIVSTKDPRFAKSPRGIRIELQIAPYTEDESGKISQSRQTLEDSAYTFTSIAYVYGSDEVEIPLEQDNTAIYESKYITNFDDRAVLYGSPKFNNVMYLSGILGFKGITSPLSYFPLNFALDQFDAPIVHVQPYKDRLIVFTTLDIWQVTNELIEVEEGSFVDSYKAKKILQNISVEKHNKNTIRVVGNILVFLSNNVLYALRPNLYSDLEDNLQLVVLSDSIRGLLSDPVDFLFKRLRHRNMLFLQPGDVKPTVDTFLSIHNNIIKLFLSMYIGEFKLPYMIECEYDMENARWTVHDNIACSFPIQAGVNDAAEGPFYLMKNHPTIDNGLTYMKREGVNSWIFAEDYGKRFDIKAVKVTDTEEGSAFVFNSTDSKDYEDIKKIKQPINCLIDTGNIDSSNHLYKRVSQVHMELSNIDATTVPINIDFYIDGHIRQTSNTLAIQESTTGYLEMVEKTILNEYNVSNEDDEEELQGVTNQTVGDAILTVLNEDGIAGNIQFSNWVLGVSRFAPSHRLLTRFGVSGRGRVPRANIIFELSDKIEIYRIAFVYKEQTGR